MKSADDNLNEEGFSLLEVLASIAIIGLLATLVYPAIEGMKSRANTAQCASNLRQIGITMLAYASDHDGALPSASDNSKLWPFSTWMGAIAPYASINIPGDDFQMQMKDVYSGIFQCPGKKNWKLNGSGVTDANRTSYGMNTFDTQSMNNGNARRTVLVENAAHTLLVADTGCDNCVLRNSNYMYGSSSALRHSNADNVLFCDGHVQAIPKSGVSYDLILKP